jgi:hypothetical protein
MQGRPSVQILRRSQVKILSLTLNVAMPQELKLAMQKFNCYVQLLRTIAFFPWGKGTLVPKWPGAESGALLEECVEITAQN